MIRAIYFFASRKFKLACLQFEIILTFSKISKINENLLFITDFFQGLFWPKRLIQRNGIDS